MGRNNRARRKQKQRRKKGYKNKSTKTAPKLLVSVADLSELCEPVTISLATGEPPPPGIMGDWRTYTIPKAAKPLRSLLIGFIDFLFHDDPAKGDLDRLLPHDSGMEQADLAWLYSLLYAYCLISDQNCEKDDIDALVKVESNRAFPFDIDKSDSGLTKVLCAPFYLLFWVMGRSIDQGESPNVWLRDWLGSSPLDGLIPHLQKFLALKRPRPEQKTVKNLEAALTSIKLDGHDEWLDGLHQLVSVFLHQRLGAAQRQSEGWQQCPQISRLGGLLDMPTSPDWSQLSFPDANTATLNRLNRLVDTSSMPYTERLSIEALKCRILSRYVVASEFGEEDFERQFEHLIHLLTARVPARHTDFAEHCLEMTCEWLAQQVGYGRLPPLAATRIRRLSRQRPEDYRLALLTFLARGGRKPKAKNSNAVDFKHIHFPLFFRALDDSYGSNTVLGHFFWPLTGEAKKALFIQCCQKLFLGMNEYEAEDFWERWRGPLFDVTQAPFDAIVKGHACEADMLFFTALAAVDTGYGTHWVQADHLASLIHSAEQLLSAHASGFNQECVIALLIALSTHQHAASLFRSWPQVISLIQKIDFPAEITIFLRVALEASHHQAHGGTAENNELYAICQTLPSLRQYIPRKKLKKAAQEEPGTAQLSLFHEP